MFDAEAAPRALAPPFPAVGGPARDLAWIEVAPGAPYFVTDRGEAWTPVGHNDSIGWTDLRPLYLRRDLSAVDARLRYMAAHGTTCVRLMLECLHGHNRFIERPAGRFNPRVVRLWDDLFHLCAKNGLRVLLTPFDTFWTWIHWSRHPYNRANGGPLDRPSRMLLDPGAREAIKARLSFAVERWGGSGVLFAWDLWNEIHPAQAQDSADVFPEFIADLSAHVRTLERRLYGRSHPQTVSLFGPELAWRPDMPLAEPIFRHPDLDFASIHIYAEGTIDHPRNTVDAAVDMGRIVRDCVGEVAPGRPFLDTEHGPIHTFKDRKKTLPRSFDDELFRHMQWAHLASGGAGGGMRWPNRRPHVLTAGMRRAQAAMGAFLPRVDWPRFARRNVSAELEVEDAPSDLAAFACADARQVVAYLLRRDTLDATGRAPPDAAPTAPRLALAGLEPGARRAVFWSTREGRPVGESAVQVDGDGRLELACPPFAADLALCVTPPER